MKCKHCITWIHKIEYLREQLDAYKADHEAMELLRSGDVRSVEAATVEGVNGYVAESGTAVFVEGEGTDWPWAFAIDPATAIIEAAKKGKPCE
jgi:hypothetical protein